MLHSKRTIIIGKDDRDVNLRELQDGPAADDQVTITVREGVTVGSTSTGSPGLRTGSPG